jgi:nucleotide-binding universal stress UspA family protein
VAALSRSRRIVCGVDGGAEAREAVRQAAELAGPAGRIEVVTVTPASAGFPCRDRAATALADAGRTAHHAGVGTESRAVAAATAAAGLIRAAAGAELLVVGCDALGPTPKAVLRRAPCSVLLARRRSEPAAPGAIVAGDAGPARAAAERLAREHGVQVHLVPAAEIIATAAAVGCGLIVVADGAAAAEVARLAPCSVLVVRGHP